METSTELKKLPTLALLELQSAVMAYRQAAGLKTFGQTTAEIKAHDALERRIASIIDGYSCSKRLQTELRGWWWSVQCWLGIPQRRDRKAWKRPLDV